MMKETYDYWNANFAKVFRNVKENTENFNARVMNAILKNERRKTLSRYLYQTHSTVKEFAINLEIVFEFRCIED